MRTLSTFLLGAALLLGCAVTSTDLQQPRGVAVDAAGQPATKEQILRAIRVGTARKRWAIVKEEPGVVVASVISGGHEATVRIEYDEHGWVILHQQSSPGLRYDPDYDGRVIIHQRYNFWVRHLNRAIEQALAESRAVLPAPAPTSGGTAPSAAAPASSAPSVAPAAN